MTAQNTGLLLSAPCSGSGKTTLTLAILRALRNQGYTVRSAKSGPDYIDSAFHSAASGKPCVNLDAWAMAEDDIIRRARGAGDSDAPLLIEGAMGLFDGAMDAGKGASADLARILNIPVVLVLDVSAQAQSIAALVAGFAGFDPRLRIAGVILNKLGSARHEAMIRTALAPLPIPVLGAVHRHTGLEIGARHLGLMQAGELPDLDIFLNRAARRIADCVDLPALLSVFTPLPDVAESIARPRFTPPAQNLAIAKDTAFGFIYEHILADWRGQGANIAFFSPLADQPPPPADMIILPGGYPELHAGRLAGNSVFMQAMRAQAQAGVAVYGECGGYMVMGQGLVDKGGARHGMLGLLNLETSFATPRRHLGYRKLAVCDGGGADVWRGVASRFMAHEFHYASTITAKGAPLFTATAANGESLPPMGLQNGRQCGSFAHIIDVVV